MTLTPERLAQIRDSIPTGYEGPWQVTPSTDDQGNLVWLIGYPTDNPDAGLVATIPDYGEQLAEFMAAARTDVPDLLAEVDRLTALVPQCNGLCLTAADVGVIADIKGDGVAYAHGSCPLHGDLEKAARELEALSITALAILRDLVNGPPCDHEDVHGHWQASVCPYSRARDLLAGLNAKPSEQP